MSTSGGEYEKGTSLTISATANTGYEFEKGLMIILKTQELSL